MNSQMYRHNRGSRRVLSADAAKRSLQVIIGREGGIFANKSNNERHNISASGVHVPLAATTRMRVRTRTFMYPCKESFGTKCSSHCQPRLLQFVTPKYNYPASFSIPSQYQHDLYQIQRRWLSTIKRDEKGKSKCNNDDDSNKKDSANEAGIAAEEERMSNRQWMLSGLSKETQNQIDAWITQGQSIPNLITFGRIFSTPILCHWIITHEYKYAVVGCLVAGVSDYLDGYIAKNYNQTTVLGTYLDPLADKILINSIAISLAHVQILPLWCAGLWLGRDALLIGMAYRTAAIASEGRGHAVTDPSRTPFKVEPTMISKINTVLQFGTIAASLGAAATMTDVHALQQSAMNLGMFGHWNPIEGACYLTACTTVLSGMSYLDGKSMKKLKKK